MMNDNDITRINYRQTNMIIPTLETKKLVEKVADIVAKYGITAESKIKDDLNPKYAFLNESDPYYNYYQEILSTKIKRANLAKEEESWNSNTTKDKGAIDLMEEQNEFWNKKREQDNNTTMTNKTQTESKSKTEIQNQLRSIWNNSIISLVKTNETVAEINKAKPPKLDQFSISHPNIPGLDMDIIKITAQFIAKNGQKFLTDWIDRESNNNQFNFLKPQHYWFGYFTFLVGCYSKILIDKNDKIRKMLQGCTNKELLLKDANNRVWYEKKIKKLQKKQGYNDNDWNEDTKKSNFVDWNNFIVVETIDFNDDNVEEEGNSNNNNKDLITEENADDGKIGKKGDSIKEDINEKDDINVADDSVQDNNNNNNNNDSIRNINKNYSHLGKEGEFTYVNDMKIMKNYKRSKIVKDHDDEMICPLCKLSVKSEIFQKHIKIELWDPKWKEVEKAVNERMKTSNLVNPTDFITYLGEFSESRPDWFGDVHMKQKEVKDKGKEKGKQMHSQQFWDGFNPEMSRTTANITKIKQQNQIHINESKKSKENN